ncbi:hypothetical protein [Gloeobacter kilaueensis]|uniref:Uncharacterized protein n=1 Tax=Gloeobacter kilaueensis (strain ATCC BAA-2537 / CCAP 1431/1 / ULC 316 / JS1) TaxID=1183438 RepID=U5QG78_GLOK1|nr:hypothetical protein [Gloeobacter kilaueensis]AGY56644.1 hypothetical protein GKIL_0397 [Gloeobacter kilaueensis JS1]
MQPQFIKLGERIVNLSHVVSIDFYTGNKGNLQAEVLTTGFWIIGGKNYEPNKLIFDGAEAKALSLYFDSEIAPASFMVDITHLADLHAEQEQEAYQHLRQKARQLFGRDPEEEGKDV